MAVCQSGGVITHAAITTLTLRLSITSGRPLFKCSHSCNSCSCPLCRGMPTVANRAHSKKWTGLKIMSGYLCAEQMNSMLCMQWSHKACISSALQGGIIHDCTEGGGNALYIHQSRVLNEIMRPEYRVQQCVANVLVWMSKLSQLISPVIHPFTQTVTKKKYLSKMWGHTISGS